MFSKLIGLYKSVYTDKKTYCCQLKANKGAVQFFNWWGEPFQDSWLCQFMENSGLLANSNKRIGFCSVFGSRQVLDFVSTEAKVFFTGENLHNASYADYADALLGDKRCDLSLGFDYFEDERYMRFPLWLMYMFEPNIDLSQIKERCAQLRCPPQKSEKKHFASLIARYDTSGLRTEIYNALSQIDRIDCPSQVLHNDDSLHADFDDNKTKYLQRYRFNICPENSNSYGYVTEKLFEAIGSGCVPIYWGSYNTPEIGIVNPDAIVFWDKNNGGCSSAKTIEELHSNSSLYRDFASQPRLLKTAEEKVEEMIIGLYDRLKEIISSL